MHSVVFNATLEQALTLVGSFVFAISGALLAVRKRYDVVGMTVLAEITATGGGVTRDVLLGAVPPSAFTDHLSFLIPIVAVVVTFYAHRQMNRMQAPVLVFDAAGLGLFCVAGTAKALEHGMGAIGAIALGAISAVGGGVLRDVLANEQPAVLRADSELYAVPAVLGSALVVLITRLRLYGSVTAGLAAALVFAVRLAALRYGWRAPAPTREEE